MKYTNGNSAAERLQDVAHMEGTEMGEVWYQLCDLWNKRDYISEELRAILEQELIKEAEMSHTHYRIITETVPVEKLETYRRMVPVDPYEDE